MTAPAVPAAEDLTGPSLLGRLTAIFAKPAGAWTGLARRPQWWFPLLVMMLCNVAFTLTLHERAIIPMITSQWDQMVDSGQMTAERVEQMTAFFRSPAGMAMSVGQQVIVWPILMLILGVGISFGVGFVLGNRMSFRLAFEVANWASLILIPSYAITWVLAWTKETLRGIHLGLGALVPMSEPPEKIQIGLASLGDAIGPFNLWFLAVAVLGASALTGAPRKSVAWVLGGLYVALAIFMSALAFVFTPGS
jgi:hypothetical protein